MFPKNCGESSFSQSKYKETTTSSPSSFKITSVEVRTNKKEKSFNESDILPLVKDICTKCSSLFWSLGPDFKYFLMH